MFDVFVERPRESNSSLRERCKTSRGSTLIYAEVHQRGVRSGNHTGTLLKVVPDRKHSSRAKKIASVAGLQLIVSGGPDDLLRLTVQARWTANEVPHELEGFPKGRIKS